MNLSEKIALDCGVKLNKPFVDKFFYPVIDEKYIVIDSRSTFKEGVYDYYKDVVQLVEPYLSENNIEIYQFADDSSIRIKSKKCFIKINKKQENYIIDKSQLVVSNENYTLYTASALNKKSIGLYSVFNPSSRAPIWNKNNQVVLESDRLKYFR
jgi:ADP-heptose:LPS heptosyltransferase